MLKVTKEGDLQISSKWVDSLVSNSDKDKKKQLFFLSHIGSIKSNGDTFIQNITKDNTCVRVSNQLNARYDSSNCETVHLNFWYDGLSIESLHIIKFMFLLSSCFLIHLNPSNDKIYDDISVFIIQSLFFYAISEDKNNKMKKTMVILLINNESSVPSSVDDNLNEIEQLWKKCLDTNNINNPISLKDYFEFHFFNSNDIKFENIQNSLISSGKFEKTWENVSYSQALLQDNFNKKWIRSNALPKELLMNAEDKTIKESMVLYFADSAFHEVWQFSQKILKKWVKVIYKGKTINNYGKIVFNFLENVNQKFDSFIPKDYDKSQITIKKKLKINNIVQQRILFLFTKQLLNLQSQALEKFKDNLLKIASDLKKNFDSEKKLAIESISQWFVSHAEALVSYNSKLSYLAAQKELDNVLIEFAEKFKESPIIKLQSLQRIEKQTSTSSLKQSGIVVGFGLTAALRPHGFGNFQLITSYTQGPHVFNFSLVNDRDIAEQEGQGKIKPFRIQPSLNFDIEL
jgi:hypothetical protein